MKTPSKGYLWFHWMLALVGFIGYLWFLRLGNSQWSHIFVAEMGVGIGTLCCVWAMSENKKPAGVVGKRA